MQGQLLPIGESDFETVRHKHLYYVDKSLFIQEVIQEMGFRHRENVNFVGRCQQITATCMLAQSMQTWIQKTIYKFSGLIV
jgi:hypothetical protein